MESIISFLDTMKELMEDNKLSVNQFALRIGCDKAAIRRWQYKMYLPDPDSVIKICNSFNISADYLFGLSDDKEYIKQVCENTFYERYAKIRDARGCSDYLVSKKCNIRDSAISKWKAIKKFPTTDSLIKLAGFFHCRLDYLLGRSSD